MCLNHCEQEDIRRLVEELAKRLDQPQETSGTMQSEFSTAMQLELHDLKTKVLHLTEQNTEHSGILTFLANMSEQVHLMEQQIIKWRCRLPDSAIDCLTRQMITAEDVWKLL